MKQFDIVAQENDAFDHFNTGWLWMRRGEAASAAWNEVIEMDKVSKSRDQNRFNEVLGTADFRKRPSPDKPRAWDYVARNGLKVHVLDPRNFYSWHFERDVPRWSRHDAVAMHITCGDDEATKVYMQKSLGFWPDTEGYYSQPARLLSFEHLGGTQAEVRQMVRIALVLAYYSGRAVMPPTHVVFTDIKEWEDGVTPSPISSLPSYSSFPWPHIAAAFRGQLDTVEAGYAANAAKFLLGSSLLGRGQVRDGLEDEWDFGQARKAEQALALLQATPLDVHEATSLSALVELITSPPFDSAQHIKLINFQLPSSPSPHSALSLPRRKDGRGVVENDPIPWTEWTLPESVAHVETCYNLSRAPGCETICRFQHGKRVQVSGGWPTRLELREGEWGTRAE